jgi:hypothetical protein
MKHSCYIMKHSCYTILVIPFLLYHSCYTIVVTFLLYQHRKKNHVSDLLEQLCNKSDNAIKLVTICQQLVPNLLQQLGTSSANTTCRQLLNRFVTPCLQTCNNLCVVTCVGYVCFKFAIQFLAQQRYTHKKQ